jgi:hypothetical protein
MNPVRYGNGSAAEDDPRWIPADLWLELQGLQHRQKPWRVAPEEITPVARLRRLIEQQQQQNTKETSNA